MSKIPPELRKTATKAVSIERQEVGSRKFGHDARNVAESSELGKEFSQNEGALSFATKSSVGVEIPA